jgi:uridylate kinase
VVGGGNLFRGVSGASRGLDRVRADQMGMLATVMNALALQDCFLANGVPASVYSGLPVPSICDAFRADRARAERDAGSIVILAGGTGNPFFTTDTTAALRAAELRCDAILKATQVDGIYSSDPKLDANATRYDRLTFSEVLSHNLKVMDAAAIAIARDNKIPIVVFSLGEQRAILNVLTGRALFTMVSGI